MVKNIEKYDEELVRKLMEKIIFYNDTLKIVFKSGLEVKIEK